MNERVPKRSCTAVNAEERSRERERERESVNVQIIRYKEEKEKSNKWWGKKREKVLVLLNEDKMGRDDTRERESEREGQSGLAFGG